MEWASSHDRNVSGHLIIVRRIVIIIEHTCHNSYILFSCDIFLALLQYSETCAVFWAIYHKIAPHAVLSVIVNLWYNPVVAVQKFHVSVEVPTKYQWGMLQEQTARYF